MTIEEVNEFCETTEEELLKVDGYDDCIEGIGYHIEHGHILVYSERKMLDKMVKEDGMTYDEAKEYFDFNIAGAYVGEKTPIFML